jgi:hypothetical protein
MKPSVIPVNMEHVISLAVENRKVIARNLAEASAYDSKAEKELKAGDNEKAAYYTILSQEYLRIASEAKIEDIKLHSLYN